MAGQLREALSQAFGKEADTAPRPRQEGIREDEFLSMADLVPVTQEAAHRELDRLLSEMDEFISGNRWEDMVSIFHPVDEKQPEMVEHGLDAKLRSRVAFALGQLKRFDEAITELLVCVSKEPGMFLYHSSLAFTAYNSLFAASNREIFLRGRARAERIELAHRHFEKARELRPDGVTNLYRHGMLYRKIERKTRKALPLFEMAVSNWDGLQEKDRERRHQERKNFVKSLYQMAASLLETGRPQEALEAIRRCLAEDEKSGHISLLFKYFALGKVYYHLNRFGEARDALEFALRAGTGENDDFVCELLGRVYLALKDPQKALDAVDRVPEKRRRPFVRWTEADILCALNRPGRAKAVLISAQERDRRSRHKTLMRLARIEYSTGDFDRTVKAAAEANRFFQERWANPFYEAIFWEALGAYRLGHMERARDLALELKAHNPFYPKLDLLLSRLEV